MDLASNDSPNKTNKISPSVDLSLVVKVVDSPLRDLKVASANPVRTILIKGVKIVLY